MSDVAEKPRIRVKAGRAPVPAVSSRPQIHSGYLRHGDRKAYLQVPQPALRDAQDDIEESYEEASARITDALQNSGWVSGLVDTIVSLMVGSGLRLNAKPDGSAWGWDEKQTSEWAKKVERRFNIYAKNPRSCDAGGRHTLGQITTAAMKQWFGTGEIVADMPYFSRPGTTSRSRIRLVPSHWMSQDANAFTRLRQGVFLDRHGASRGYRFRVTEQNGTEKVIDRKAHDRYGRKKILHVFDGAAGQLRGISCLTPVVKVISQYEQLADATLTAALIHAIFAATIESDYPSSDVLNALQTEEDRNGSTDLSASERTLFDSFMVQKVGWHKNVDINLGNHGRIAHLLMGETLKLNGSEHPNSTFEPFANFLLREVAKAAGVMFEDVSGDFRGATYSSVRMGIAKMWPLLIYRRKNIAAQIPQTVYENFLEEEIDQGRIDFPGGVDGFTHYRDQASNAEWGGPPKPQADDLKSAKAHREYKDMGVMSDEDICNDLGTDNEAVYEQRAREQLSRVHYKLPEYIPAQGGAPGKPLDEKDGGDE